MSETGNRTAKSGIAGSELTPEFSSPIEAIEDHIKQCNKDATIYESLMLEYVFKEKKIHKSYYFEWSRQARETIKIMTRMKHRQAAYKAETNDKAEVAESTLVEAEPTPA